MEFREKPMQNLIRIREKEICKNVQALLLDGESIVGAYKTVRDQAVFTSHRIFIVDMQGVTGTRQEIFVLPYRKIVHFGIQTAGFGDPLQTSELTVCYADEHEMKFGFIGQEELLAVALLVDGHVAPRHEDLREGHAVRGRAREPVSFRQVVSDSHGHISPCLVRPEWEILRDIPSGAYCVMSKYASR